MYFLYGIYNKYLRNKDVPTERRNVAVPNVKKNNCSIYEKSAIYAIGDIRLILSWRVNDNDNDFISTKQQYTFL